MDGDHSNTCREIDWIGQRDLREDTYVSRNIPSPSKLSVSTVSTIDWKSAVAMVSPTLPNTGPGVARPFVNQIAIPSPYR